MLLAFLLWLEELDQNGKDKNRNMMSFALVVLEGRLWDGQLVVRRPGVFMTIMRGYTSTPQEEGINLEAICQTWYSRSTNTLGIVRDEIPTR